MKNEEQSTKEKWNAFVLENPAGSFLQSWEWGELQGRSGRRYWRLNFDDFSQGLLIKYNLIFGKSYLYCPQGPLFNSRAEAMERKAGLSAFIKEAEKIAQQEDCIFLRCDPREDLQLRERSFRLSPANYYFSAVFAPPAAAILEITGAEDKILARMKSKTRYNIRLAEKKDLHIVLGNSPADLDNFYRLICRTANRQGVKPHSREHYQKLLDIFGRQIFILTAWQREAPVAAVMILCFGLTATYLHGGLDFRYKNLMAPYLLQWSAIKEARKRGCHFYDLGGVAPAGAIGHPWSSITRFKAGLGAKTVVYPGAFDLIFQPIWYQLYHLIKKLKR